MCTAVSGTTNQPAAEWLLLILPKRWWARGCCLDIALGPLMGACPIGIAHHQTPAFADIRNLGFKPGRLHLCEVPAEQSAAATTAVTN